LITLLKRNMFALFITPVLAMVLTMGSGFALVEEVEVPIMERAASSQMGFGHAPAAGAASAVERRWKQEEDLDSLGSAGVVASGAREVKAAHSSRAREQGDMFIVAGNANFGFVDAGGAPSPQRGIDRGVMDTNVEYHHQEVQAGSSQHPPAGFVPLRGPIDQYHGHNFPERMTQSGNRRNHFSDIGGSAMPFSDPQPSGQDLTLAAVNTRRQGLGAAYPPAPGSAATVQSGRIMNQQRPRRTSNSNHFGGFGMKIDPLRRPAQCPQTCDLTAWPKCQCVSPATYSDDGRGNCNVGAMKIDLQVWCYVDPSIGNPLLVGVP